MANEAFAGKGVTLTSANRAMTPRNAGCITVTIARGVSELHAFRVVGNVGHNLYVHDLGEPTYGPFDLADVAAVPFQEIFDRFIHMAKD